MVRLLRTVRFLGFGSHLLERDRSYSLSGWVSTEYYTKNRSKSQSVHQGRHRRVDAIVNSNSKLFIDVTVGRCKFRIAMTSFQRGQLAE